MSVAMISISMLPSNKTIDHQRQESQKLSYNETGPEMINRVQHGLSQSTVILIEFQYSVFAAEFSGSG